MLPLARWSPLRDLSSLQREIDELFGRAFGRGGRLLPQILGEGFGYPAMDCARKGDKFLVRLELPGIEPDDVDISVTGNLLTIKGERKTEKEIKEEDYIVREVGYGNFERSLVLPEGVDADKIKAGYNKGILEISMPAATMVKGRKVNIEVEEGKEKKKLKAA